MLGEGRIINIDLENESYEIQWDRFETTRHISFAASVYIHAINNDSDMNATQSDLSQKENTAKDINAINLWKQAIDFVASYYPVISHNMESGIAVSLANSVLTVEFSSIYANARHELEKEICQEVILDTLEMIEGNRIQLNLIDE